MFVLLGDHASAQTTSNDALIARGRGLFSTSCVSCHGDDGNGVTTTDGRARGPSVRAAGAAGVVGSAGAGVAGREGA